MKTKKQKTINGRFTQFFTFNFHINCIICKPFLHCIYGSYLYVRWNKKITFALFSKYYTLHQTIEEKIKPMNQSHYLWWLIFTFCACFLQTLCFSCCLSAFSSSFSPFTVTYFTMLHSTIFAAVFFLSLSLSILLLLLLLLSVFLMCFSPHNITYRKYTYRSE